MCDSFLYLFITILPLPLKTSPVYCPHTNKVFLNVDIQTDLIQCIVQAVRKSSPIQEPQVGTAKTLKVSQRFLV